MTSAPPRLPVWQCDECGLTVTGDHDWCPAETARRHRILAANGWLTRADWATGQRDPALWDLNVAVRQEELASRARGRARQAAQASRAQPLRLTSCELGAICRPYSTSDSEHTYHVAVVAWAHRATTEQVVRVLESDPVTVRRWSAPRRAGLRSAELTVMLPRARDAARPCPRGHRPGA